MPGHFRIGTAARLSGIAVATLRNWERRYGLVVASRAPSGHRLYTREQIERLKWIKRHLDRGLSPSEAHALLREQLDGDKAAAASAAQKLAPGISETLVAVAYALCLLPV